MVDVIKEPDHYKGGEIEAINIIEQVVETYESKTVGYLIGQVLKYVIRSPFKGTQLQDLQKAKQYLSRAISRLEGRNTWE